MTVINPYDGHIVQQSLAVGQGPSDAGLSPDGSKLYVLNSTDKTITVAQTYDFLPIGTPIAIDSTTTQIATAVAGDNDSNIYVALKAKNGRNGWVKKIPVLGAPVTLPVGINPTSIKVSPDNKTIYVSNTDSGSVTSIDVAAFAVNSNITTGPGTKLIKP